MSFEGGGVQICLYTAVIKGEGAAAMSRGLVSLNPAGEQAIVRSEKDRSSHIYDNKGKRSWK